MQHKMKKRRNMKILTCGAAILLLAACGRAEPPPGLTVQDGQFYKDGKPFYGAGINYFNSFIRITGMSPNGPDPENRDYVEGFRVLKSYGIPFVRFCAGGFWPSDWKLYQTDKELYFKLLDEFVAEAEKQELGLIPSLFWTYSTVPDLTGETLDQLGNPESKTCAFIRQYTKEVVSRYVHSPAIWGWEFGNEYINEADLSQPEFGRGWIVPDFGTPSVRTARDKMYRKNVWVAYRAFEETIRSIDRTRPVFTGDTMPRITAWHNYREGSWTLDSPEQWKEIFLLDNPYDTLTVHFYYYEPGDSSHQTGVSSYDRSRQMEFLMEIARDADKPLFVGEFGQDKVDSAEQRIQQAEEMMRIILKNKVQLAALWNYDFEHADQVFCNITETNEHSVLLKKLQCINREMNAVASESDK